MRSEAKVRNELRLRERSKARGGNFLLSNSKYKLYKCETCGGCGCARLCSADRVIQNEGVANINSGTGDRMTIFKTKEAYHMVYR